MENHRIHATRFLPIETIIHPIKDSKLGTKVYQLTKKGRGFGLKALKKVTFVTDSSIVKGARLGLKALQVGVVSLELIEPIAAPLGVVSFTVKIPLESLRAMSIPTHVYEILSFSGVLKVGKSVCELGKGGAAIVELVKLIPYAKKAASFGTMFPVLNIITSSFTIGSSACSLGMSVKKIVGMYKPFRKNLKNRAFWKKGITEESVAKRIEHLAKKKILLKESTVDGQIGLWKDRKEECQLKKRNIKKWNVVGKTTYSWHTWRANREIKAWERIERNEEKKERHDAPLFAHIERIEKKAGKWLNIEENINSDVPEVQEQLQQMAAANLKKHNWKLYGQAAELGIEFVSMGGNFLQLGGSIASIALLASGYGTMGGMIALAAVGGVAAGMEISSHVLTFGKRKLIDPKGKTSGHWNMVKDGKIVLEEVEEKEPVQQKRWKRAYEYVKKKACLFHGAPAA